MPQCMDLDYGHPDLKAYAKVLAVLKLVDLPGVPGEEPLDILVKTDVVRKVLRTQLFGDHNNMGPSPETNPFQD